MHAKICFKSICVQNTIFNQIGHMNRYRQPRQCSLHYRNAPWVYQLDTKQHCKSRLLKTRRVPCSSNSRSACFKSISAEELQMTTQRYRNLNLINCTCMFRLFEKSHIMCIKTNSCIITITITITIIAITTMAVTVNNNNNNTNNNNNNKCINIYNESFNENDNEN